MIITQPICHTLSFFFFQAEDGIRGAAVTGVQTCALPISADLAVPSDRDELIAYGPLLSDDGATWLGTAVLVRAPDPDKARAELTPDGYADIEVHNWAFGGRPVVTRG